MFMYSTNFYNFTHILYCIVHAILELLIDECNHDFTENGTFVSPASDLGLSVTDGNKIASVLPGNGLLVNISINCTSEKAEYSSDKQQHFLAVATWEKTQIHRQSDFIKVTMTYYVSNTLLDCKVIY